MSAVLLRVENLQASYGTLDAVHDVSLEVDDGEIVTLLGHNGAGKSTTLKCIHGMHPLRGGQVEFDGADISSESSAQCVARGICYIPEDGFVFPRLSVHENLAVATLVKDGPAVEGQEEAVFEHFPVLAERRQQSAGTLSGGEKRMLSLGMAMMSRPRMLLLDEPSLGLAPVLVERILEMVEQLAREESLSVLMVEQNVEQALHVSERVYVMRAGRTILRETAEAMARRGDWWDLY